MSTTKRKYLTPLLAAAWLFLSLATYGQTYTPGSHVVVNDAVAPAQATPLEARSMFYDGTNFLYRAYNGTAEVLTYLNTTASRSGHFIIVVDSGGALQSNGTYIGGYNTFYMFKDSTTSGGLVKMNLFGAGVGTCSGCLLAANNLADLGNLPASLVNLGLNNVNNTSDATKNAASVSLTNHTISGAANSLTNIPNSALNNSTIGLTLNSTGVSPQVTTTPAALGTSLVITVPWTNGTDSGFLKGTDWIFFHGKLDSVHISNDSVYNCANGTCTLQSVLVGGGGGGTVTSVLISNDSLYYLIGSAKTFVGLVLTWGDSTFMYVTPTQLAAGLAPKLSTVSTTNSVTGNGTPGSPIQLVGDVASPGPSQYWGTNPSSVRGFYSLPGGITSANPTAQVQLSPVNGSAVTFMRSDAAPSLSQAIAPTWTGLHTFSNGLLMTSSITFGSNNTYNVGSVSDVAAHVWSRVFESEAGVGLQAATGNNATIYINASPGITLLSTLQAQFNAYGAGTYTGTTATVPGFTSGGLVVENGITGTGNVVFSASPALTGTPTVPTQTTGDNTTAAASDAFVNASIAAIPPVTITLKRGLSAAGPLVAVLGNPNHFDSTVRLNAGNIGGTTNANFIFDSVGIGWLVNGLVGASGTPDLLVHFTDSSVRKIPYSTFQTALSGTGYVKFAGSTPSFVAQIPLSTDVTGILPVANGGTGVATAAANTAFGNFTGSTAAPGFGKVTLAAQATNAANTLMGYDGSGNPVDVTAGTGVTIAAGVISSTGGGSSLTYQRINSGTSATVTGGNYIVSFQFTLNISAFTLTLPASPSDQQVVKIQAFGMGNGSTMITSLTVLANSGQTITELSPLTSFKVGQYALFRYDGTNATWNHDN